MNVVLRYADPWAMEYVEPAFSGDPDTALELAVALSNDKRGAVAVAMWDAKIPRPAFRMYLEAVWEHDYARLIGAAGTRRRLAAMFRYAAFPLPDFMGETVHIWRGTSGASVSLARTGYSWTLDHDIACWFAMRFANPARQPLVLAADVPRADIVIYTNEREEAEAVLMRPPAASVDGTPEDWQRHYEAVQAARRHASLPAESPWWCHESGSLRQQPFRG